MKRKKTEKPARSKGVLRGGCKPGSETGTSMEGPGSSFSASRFHAGGLFSWKTRALMAVASGVLTSLAFFRLPYGLNGVLVFFSLVPLFAATSGAGAVKGALYSSLAGFTGCAIAFHWIVPLICRFSGFPVPVAVLGFLLWLLWSSLFWGVFGSVWAGSSGRRFRGLLCVAFPVVLEYLWPRIFPWHFGDPVVELPALAQIAALSGVFAVTALCLVVNYALWTVCLWLFLGRRSVFPLTAVATGCLCFGGALIFGVLTLHSLPRAEAELDAALVHTAVPLEEKHGVKRHVQFEMHYGRVRVKRGREAEAFRQRLVSQGRKAVGSAENHEKGSSAEGLAPDSTKTVEKLVVFPEAMFAVVKGAEDGLLSEQVGAPVLYGADVHSWPEEIERGLHFNSVCLDTESGRQYYHKHHLLVFGETAPFREWAPWLEDVLGIRSLDAGKGPKVLELRSGTVGPLVCYEVILPGYVRRFVKEGAGLLVNVTEDGWYGWTGEPYQHLLLARFRAVENRRFLLRCVNNGISAVVAPTGEVVASDCDRKTPGFVRKRVGFFSSLTPYTRAGPWIIYLLLPAVLIDLGIRVIRRMRIARN